MSAPLKLLKPCSALLHLLILMQSILSCVPVWWMPGFLVYIIVFPTHSSFVLHAERQSIDLCCNLFGLLIQKVLLQCHNKYCLHCLKHWSLHPITIFISWLSISFIKSCAVVGRKCLYHFCLSVGVWTCIRVVLETESCSNYAFIRWCSTNQCLFCFSRTSCPRQSLHNRYGVSHVQTKSASSLVTCQLPTAIPSHLTRSKYLLLISFKLMQYSRTN